MTTEAYYQGFEHRLIQTPEGVDINTYWGGTGNETLLLLHGHPETCLIWREIAPVLAQKYRVVLTDLRGYGDSGKPTGGSNHDAYSKRAMADDQLYVMDYLGVDRFHLVGHDRGARVAYRLIKDHPGRVISCTLMDILPTNFMYADTTQNFAEKYWHWFFYIQPEPLPERMMAADAELFIRANLQKKVSLEGRKRFPEDVLEEYIRCFSDPSCVHAICEDYRASATIDAVLDRSDEEEPIQTPLLLLWGKDGVVGKLWDVEQVWKKYASDVTGFPVEHCGHFVPEEQPEYVTKVLINFIEKNRRPC